MVDRETEGINDRLRAVGEGSDLPALQDAQRLRLLARRQAFERETAVLRAELDFLDDQGELLPLQRDREQRRVLREEQRVDLLGLALRERVEQEVESSLASVREQCDDFREQLPSLSALADDTEFLAEELWAPEGVVIAHENVARELVDIRRHTVTLDRLIQNVRRYYEAVGLEDITSWWPSPPDGMPTLAAAEQRVEEIESSFHQIQKGVLDFEKNRRELGDISLQAHELAVGPEGQEASTSPEQVEAVVQSMLLRRRELLDSLIREYGMHSNQLLELEGLYRHYFNDASLGKEFLLQNQLWARSVDGSLLPSATDLRNAAAWYVSPANWWEVLSALWAGLTASYWYTLLFAAVLIALLAFRTRTRGRLTALGERASSEATFRDSLEALLHTAFLAAPLPLVLYGLALALEESPSLQFAAATAVALRFVRPAVAVLQLSRQVLSPGGLAESHFLWPGVVTRALHRGLRWAEPVFLPLFFVACHFAAAGLELTSPDELRGYNNSLGRLLFIAAFSVLHHPQHLRARRTQQLVCSGGHECRYWPGHRR